MGQPCFATEEILFTHVRLLCSVVHEWFVYCTLPHSPPWRFVRVLSQNVRERDAEFVHMQNVLQLFRNLESACNANAARFLRTLLLHKLACLSRTEQSLRPLVVAWGLIVANELHSEMVNKLTHSLLEEHEVNALRDNEQRGARHHQRGDATLASLTIATRKEHYPNVPCVDSNLEDVTSFSSVQVSRSGFHPETVHSNTKDICVNVTALLCRRSLPSTSIDKHALNQLCLLRALLVTPSACWDGLWLACLFAKDVITARASTCMFYYVLGTTRRMLCSVALLHARGQGCCISI